MAAGINVLPFEIYAAPYRVLFPILDADGDLVADVAGDTPDSQISKDCGSMTACTNELTELETNMGVYYLDLTAAEMTADVVVVICKSATAGTKTTPIVLYPRRLTTVCSGTASAGAEGSITLASPSTDYNYNDFYNGMFVQATNNDPAGIQGQTRLITDYAEATRIASVAPNWATTPTSATTYAVLRAYSGITAGLDNLTVGIKDDAITSAKYDESTAFPMTEADSGTTTLLRANDDMVQDWFFRDALNYGFDATEDRGGNLTLLLDAPTLYEFAALFGDNMITAGATATFQDILKAIYAMARGKITKSGNTYTFYDDDGTSLFTWTMAAGVRTPA